MKHTKRTVVAFLVALTVICTLSISLTACNHPLDSENRPFSMSISTPDGVFNPFFSTSGYDSSIISMTQIGMINTDERGQIVVGENEPTVAKDYTITENDDNTSTYEFLIKNGIKFSDGSALTIKDVLFNLYVYLDPVYTGAATIYSTDIVGLQQYRQQDLDAGSSSGTAAFEASFIAKANKRIDDLIQYLKMFGILEAGDTRPEEKPAGFDEERGILDIAYIGKTFYEELVSDWNAINLEDYKDWKFTEKWQVFLLNDGGDNSLLAREYEGGPYIKDDKGNYQLDTVRANRIYVTEIGPELVRKGLATESNGKFNVTGKKEDVDDAIKYYCIQEVVFKSKFSDSFPMSVIKNTDSKLTLSNDEKVAIKAALKKIFVAEFETVARYWGTASTILEKFKADAKTDYFKQNDNKLVPTISGITTRTESKEFNGKTLDEKYDVLRITINGIDPKAIYNFGFTVAPMYYYSSTDWRDKNYIAAFDAEKGEFGLEFGNSDFMNEVINSPDKIKLPMGAGPYKASSVDGKPGTKDTFFKNNMVYYARNDFFYTTGKQIENAKIKYVRYKVVESDQIVNALKNGDIDFGDPTAKQENQQLLSGLETVAVNTNGYGYVGINPRFVPEVNVRRAIMKAMYAKQIINDYYKGGFGEELFRPMSLESWAYPKDTTTYTSRTSNGIGTPGVSYAYDATGYEIEKLLIGAGYNKNTSTGKYSKNIPGFGVDKLDYKFTIAGGSTDHPAYKMFLEAAALLNEVGFDVKVVTSQQALSDLSAGKLAVWAAAWSSTIDPDMFQVYHMDSQASSVKNWGYSQILGRTNPAAWGDEYDLVVELSGIIDEARSSNDEDYRKQKYSTALDLIMELAVEFPIYQRKDLFAYQSNLLDPSTLPTKVTPFSGLLARIWEIDYIK